MDISDRSYTYTTTTPIKIQKVFHILLFCLMGALICNLEIGLSLDETATLENACCIFVCIEEEGHG